MARNYWLNPESMNAPLIARTQSEVDELARRDVPFIILGGTQEDPIILRHFCKVPPAIGIGSHVTVEPATRSHPAAVCVIGKGAHVLGLRNARITCYGESTITCIEESKARMYCGVLIAHGMARGTLYSKAVGHFYGRSRGRCRNDSEAYCYDESFVVAQHQTKVHMRDRTAHVWFDTGSSCIIDVSYREPLAYV